MTQLVTALGEDLIDAAFERIRINAEPVGHADGRLYRLQLPALATAASEAMEKIKELLKDASRRGWELIKGKADTVLAFIEERARKLGEWADDLRQLILAKIHELMQQTYDLVLSTLRPRIQIGEAAYVLGSIDLSCKLVFSGSLEASLTTLCKFVASGEATVTGTYQLAPATS